MEDPKQYKSYKDIAIWSLRCAILFNALGIWLFSWGGFDVWLLIPIGLCNVMFVLGMTPYLKLKYGRPKNP